jgi:hypothetical protein
MNMSTTWLSAEKDMDADSAGMLREGGADAEGLSADDVDGPATDVDDRRPPHPLPSGAPPTSARRAR